MDGSLVQRKRLVRMLRSRFGLGGQTRPVERPMMILGLHFQLLPVRRLLRMAWLWRLQRLCRRERPGLLVVRNRGFLRDAHGLRWMWFSLSFRIAKACLQGSSQRPIGRRRRLWDIWLSHAMLRHRHRGRLRSLCNRLLRRRLRCDGDGKPAVRLVLRLARAVL